MKYTFLFTIAMAFLMNGCIDPNCVNGVGSPIEESRLLGDFDVIQLECEANITIKDRIMGEENKVEVKTNGNVQTMVKTVVEGRVLRIYTEGCVRPTEPIEVHLKVNDIKEIHHSASGSIKTLNALRSASMLIDCSGSGSLDLRIKADSLIVSNSGSGMIKLNGKVERISIENSGSGEVNSKSVNCEFGKASLSGSGEIHLRGDESLDLDISGSGNIYYYGSAEKVSQNVSGSGSISKKD